MIEVRLRDEAVDDILAATAWYESRCADLGVEFAAELDVVLERIVEGPEQYARQYGEVRRVLLRCFPYAVYFVIDGGVAHVLAVTSPKTKSGRVAHAGWRVTPNNCFEAGHPHWLRECSCRSSKPLGVKACSEG